MKKLLSTFFALLMLLSVFPAFPVHAAELIDISEQSPAIPADVGAEIDLSGYSYLGMSDIVWKDADGNVIEKFTPAEKGVYPLTVETNGTSKTVYVVAKDKDDTEYVIFEADFSKYSSKDELKADGYTLDSDSTYTFEDGVLLMSNSPNNYMPLVLPKWLGDFGNYSITAEAKTASENNAEYWFGIAYRAQTRGRTFYPFYQMAVHENFNPINDIQFHERTSEPLWNFAKVSGSGMIGLKDDWHTYNVSAFNRTVRYSMDGNEVLFAGEDFIGREVRYLKKGIVGITLNDIGSVYLKSIRITLQLTAPVKDATTLELVNNSHRDMNTVNPIANIESVSAKDVLTVINGENAPGSILCDIAEVDNVKAVIEKCDEKNVLPTFIVHTPDEAATLISAMEDADFKDANVVSDSAEVLSAVRTSSRSVRTGLYVDIDTPELDSKGADAIRAQVRSAPATFCVIDSENATKHNVTELQELTVAVWVEVASDPADDAFDAEVLRAVTSGANGIISKDHTALSDTVNSYLSEGTITHVPVLVGHRGDIAAAPENTISAFRKAYENGARAFELDIVITEDGEVIVLHDGDLTRTTDYEGEEGVGEMTLEEVKKYHTYDSNDNLTDETVPTLDEVFAEFKDKDCRLLIEFKDENATILDAVADIIKKYDMADRVNIISFSTKVLNVAKDNIPGISAGYLFGSHYTETLEDVLDELYLPIICTQAFNSSMCPSSSIVNTMFTQATADRGIPVWAWTYTDEDNEEAFFSGTDGMTTDDVQWATDMIREITPSAAEFKLESGNVSDITISSVTYGGETKAVSYGDLSVKIIDGEDCITADNGKITAVKDGTAHILYGYTVKTTGGAEYTLYTQPVTVTVGSESNGILWIAVGAGVAVLAIGTISGILIAKKRKSAK